MSIHNVQYVAPGLDPYVVQTHAILMKCLPIRRGAEWSSKKFGSRKILANSHGSRSLVFSAVVCASESRIFLTKLSPSLDFWPTDLSWSIDFLAFV